MFGTLQYVIAQNVRTCADLLDLLRDYIPTLFTTDSIRSQILLVTEAEQ